MNKLAVKIFYPYRNVIMFVLEILLTKYTFDFLNFVDETFTYFLNSLVHERSSFE